MFDGSIEGNKRLLRKPPFLITMHPATCAPETNVLKETPILDMKKPLSSSMTTAQSKRSRLNLSQLSKMDVRTEFQTTVENCLI